MILLEWLAAAVVVLSLIYVSFVLTLGDWFAALRKGEAVTLIPESHGRQWPVWLQAAVVVLALLVCIPFFYYLWIPLLAVPAPARWILETIGFVVYLAGLAFVLWARRTLGKNWGISTSLQVKLTAGHQLIQSGPYAWVRHPMYFGWWVAMAGLTLLYPVWAVFLMWIFSIVSFAGRARREETALAERFGQAWVEYKKHTRYLIPLLY